MISSNFSMFIYSHYLNLYLQHDNKNDDIVIETEIDGGFESNRSTTQVKLNNTPLIMNLTHFFYWNINKYSDV